MKVSIIIPVYNQQKYFIDAIESALNQTYCNKEIVIADDCSTEDIETIVKKYQQHYQNIFYYRNKTNLGRVANYHKALYDYATGDFALMLDGDDYLSNNEYIKRAVDIFKKNEEIALVFAKTSTYYEADGTTIKDLVNSNLSDIIDGNNLFINYWKGYSITHRTSLYRRDLAIKINYYCEDILSSDWESVLRLIQGNKVGFINEYVAVWRKHELNASRSLNIEDVSSNLKYIENVYDYAIKKNFFKKKMLDAWKIKMLKRYFFRVLVEFHFYQPNNLNKVWTIISNYSNKLNYLMKFDYKYIAFKIIKSYRPLLIFVTRNILKQESMLKDLELYRRK